MAPRKNAPCTVTQSKSVASASKVAKGSRKLEATNVASTADVTPELEQPAPAKKAKAVSKSKRQREPDDIEVIETEQAVPTKKVRTARKNTGKSSETQLQSPACRSARKPTKAPASPQKKRRRTKEQMAADRAKEEVEKRRLEELAEEKKQAMMKMDIDEDLGRATAAAQTIRTFADLENVTESDEEEFLGYNVVPGGSNESDSDESIPAQVNRTAKSKTHTARPKHLKTRVEVGGKENEGGGKKSTKKVAFGIASGLLSDWNSRDRGNARTIKGSVKKRTHVEISVGGLDDSDADAVNPFSRDSSRKAAITDDQVNEGTKTAKRDLSRQNTLVSFVSTDSDDEVEYVPHAAAKKIPTKKVRGHLHPPVKVETGRKHEKHPPVPKAVNAKKAKRLNGNNVRISDLLEFAEEKWRRTFLPTLLDKFFTSGQPFDSFYMASDQFIALLQTVIEEVYPDVDYEVSKSDSIHFLAYNRINEKRSNIGSNALALMKKHISTMDEKTAKDWLRWSLRKDGPLFFKVPSPQNSPIDNRDGNYQYPEGRLLSEFIIDLATPLLRLKSGSVSDNGYPKGLIALIMAALERAVRSLSKPSSKVKEFSKEFWGAKVDTYYAGLQGRTGVPDNRWKELLDMCGLGASFDDEDSDDDNHAADLSLLDNNRAFVFDFCSPAKSYA